MWQSESTATFLMAKIGALDLDVEQRRRGYDEIKDEPREKPVNYHTL